MILLRKGMKPITALLISLVFIVPLLMVIMGSLKTSVDAARFDLSLPTEWEWSNYAHVVEEGKMLRGFANSMLITCASVFLILITGSMVSFILVRRRTRISAILLNLFISGLIAPPFYITTVKFMYILGLTNSLVGVVLLEAALGYAFAIFILSGFIATVPREIDEAAVIDGAGATSLFSRIVLPLLAPIVATVTVFSFLTVWNDFQWPLLLLSDSSMNTITLSVYKFIGQRNGNDYNYVFAQLLLAMLPVLVVYLFAQKFIIEGMTGAVKG